VDTRALGSAVAAPRRRMPGSRARSACLTRHGSPRRTVDPAQCTRERAPSDVNIRRGCEDGGSSLCLRDRMAMADRRHHTREDRLMNSSRKPVAVVVGATSKWQADGRNTKLAHGKELDDRHLAVGIRWGVGGAIAQKFAREGFFVVLTTRKAANAAALEKAII